MRCRTAVTPSPRFERSQSAWRSDTTIPAPVLLGGHSVCLSTFQQSTASFDIGGNINKNSENKFSKIARHHQNVKNRGMTVHTVGVARRMSPGYTIRNKPWQRRTMKWQASSSPPPHSIIHFGLLFFCSSIRHSSHICWFLGCIG